jgi:acetolactate synthase I/II/III large subunit
MPRNEHGTTTRMTGGDAIVQSLVAHGVDTVFGLPGAQIYGLFDALHRARIRVISTRHEQAAGYMAFGYARSSTKVGVYAVVPGPGVLNTAAALCTAFGCNVPVLGLTGQVPFAYLGKGRGHLHELPDQLATLRSLVKWAERIEHPGAASALMADAFRHMRSGRQGPCVMETPWDVFGATADVVPVAPMPLVAAIEPDEAAVSKMVDAIATARRPMIWVGGGAVGAQREVAALAERLGAPVVAFRSGRGIIPEDSPLSASIVAAYRLWADTDLLIGIGSRLEVPDLRWSFKPNGLKIARIDIDPREMVRFAPDAGLVADAAAGTAAVLRKLETRDVASEARRDTILAAKAAAKLDIEKIQPHATYLAVIRSVLPRNGLFVEELCQAGFTSYFAFPVFSPRTYISSGYQGTLGFGFMTALGAKVANPDKPVVAIAGDGGFMFGIQELATAVQHGIGVVTIVFDNSAYGNVRRDQQAQYGGRLIAADLRNPDFVKLAEAFEVAAYRVESPRALAPVLERALGDDCPAVIHIPVESDAEISPWPLVHPAAPART